MLADSAVLPQGSNVRGHCVSDEAIPAAAPVRGARRTEAVESHAAFIRGMLAATRDPLAAATLATGIGRALDGEALRQLIERERVGPLLHRALRGNAVLSPETCATLRDAYRATAMRNLLLLNALRSVLERLAADGIPTIVLKGAALAQPVYGSLALRPMSDLDILVRRRDIGRARAIAEDLGFRPAALETHSGALAEYENALAFTKPDVVRIDLDVHWSLVDSPFYQRKLSMAWFWASARVQPLGGLSAATLGPEALLLHLCAHLMLHHRGAGLLWWNDIAELLHAESALDWDQAFERCRECQLLLPMREALTHLAAEWRAPIPSDALHRFADAHPQRDEVAVFNRLRVPAAAGRRFWTDLRSLANWRQRLRFARTHLLPSATYMQSRYGIRRRWLVPMYYPYRWLRGARGAFGGKLNDYRRVSS
jgi:hypothetical protein